MATPFGVYLTTGSVSGGVSKWALVATGASMALMMVVAELFISPFGDWIESSRIPNPYATGLFAGALMLAFFTIMRVVPLSGTHGAEHQVVHAIERDEELLPEIVRRMPRVHPRCGTNIAAGAFIFTTLLGWSWTPELLYREIVAVVVTLFLWRRIGSFLQQYATTKPPSDKQLEGGIRAGKMLLERYAVARTLQASPWQRIWNSGLLQLMSGSLATVLLLYGLGRLLHYDLLPGVS